MPYGVMHFFAGGTQDQWRRITLGRREDGARERDPWIKAVGGIVDGPSEIGDRDLGP